MKEFAVSFQIRTKEASVEDLIRVTGLPLSASSHTMGEIGGDGRPFAMTVGSFEVESDSGDLDVHFQRVLDELDLIRLNEVRDKLPDTTFVMNIGVFFDTANCSLDILPAHAEILGRNNIQINISCYPS